MSTSSKTAVIDIADAGAAKLAGLLIDWLQKFRDGQIIWGHVEWFLRLKKEERNKLLLGKLPVVGTVIADSINIDLVEIDISLLGLQRVPNTVEIVISRAKDILGLDMRPSFLDYQIRLQNNELYVGLMFVDSTTNEDRKRVYCVSRMYINHSWPSITAEGEKL